MTTHNTNTVDLAALRAEVESSFDSTAAHAWLADALEKVHEEGWNYSQARDFLQHGGDCDGEYDPTEPAGTRRAKYNIKNGISVYVGTWGKYNEGNLDGRWWYFADYASAEDLIKDIIDYHRQTENDPELMVQDWDLDSVAGDYLTPSDLGDYFTEELMNFAFDLQDADTDDAEKALDYLKATGYSIDHYDDFSDLLRHAEDSCCGYLDTQSWHPFQDWVEETFMELYGHEIPDSLTGYIDFERMARDWEFDYTIGEKYVFQH